MGVRAGTNARGAGDVAPEHRDLVPHTRILAFLDDCPRLSNTSQPMS
jgi:hypothetical protein